MSKRKRDENEQWFREKMTNQLERFDEAFEPESPQVDQLETMIVAHRKIFRKAMWRELLLFWLVVACILIGMGWIAETNLSWFWGLYSVAGTGCFLFFAYRMFGRAKS